MNPAIYEKEFSIGEIITNSWKCFNLYSTKIKPVEDKDSALAAPGEQQR